MTGAGPVDPGSRRWRRGSTVGRLPTVRCSAPRSRRASPRWPSSLRGAPSRSVCRPSERSSAWPVRGTPGARRRTSSRPTRAPGSRWRPAASTGRRLSRTARLSHPGAELRRSLDTYPSASRDSTKSNLAVTLPGESVPLLVASGHADQGQSVRSAPGPAGRDSGGGAVMSAPSLPDRPGLPAVPLPRLDAEHPARAGAGRTATPLTWARATRPRSRISRGAGRRSPATHAVRPNLRPRLTGLLRRLAAACRDEQFWALRSRAVGRELLRSGLCGDVVRPAAPRRGRAARHARPAARAAARRASRSARTAARGSRSCSTRWRRATPARCATACTVSRKRVCAARWPTSSRRTRSRSSPTAPTARSGCAAPSPPPRRSISGCAWWTSTASPP